VQQPIQIQGGAMSEQRPLHRLFGLSWIDFFDGTSVEVKTELDLSIKQQFVDVVLIRKGPEPIPRPLPDGFEDLAAHNLITFKSHQEPLNEWALQELVGHYVNYRKQSSPSMQDLSPSSDYKLFGVCARFPQGLTPTVVLTSIRVGVYETSGCGLTVRLIVVAQLPQREQNAMLHLFSARDELLRYGRDHYRPHSRNISTVLYKLLKAFREDPNMDKRLIDADREAWEEIRANMTLEERLKGVSAEDLRKLLPVEERLKGLTADELARVLPRETLAALAHKLAANGSPTKPQ
jgi:hypothetical protein